MKVHSSLSAVLRIWRESIRIRPALPLLSCYPVADHDRMKGWMMSQQRNGEWSARPIEWWLRLSIILSRFTIGTSMCTSLLEVANRVRCIEWWIIDLRWHALHISLISFTDDSMWTDRSRGREGNVLCLNMKHRPTSTDLLLLWM